MPHVLVVSDDRSFVDELCSTLRFRGHEVRVAYDGSEGYLSAVGERPDLVVLDSHLTGYGSLPVFRLLRSSRDTARIPVLAVAEPGDLLAREACAWVGRNRRKVAARIDDLLAAPAARSA